MNAVHLRQENKLHNNIVEIILRMTNTTKLRNNICHPNCPGTLCLVNIKLICQLLGEYDLCSRNSDIVVSTKENGF